MSSTSKKVIGVCLAIFLMTPIAFPARAQQADNAGAALREGRRLLKRGQADKALIQLRNALDLYTAAKNNSGMAAAHNELGDLYMRQGQYPVALDHYQKALDGFLVSDPQGGRDRAESILVTPSFSVYPSLTAAIIMCGGEK